MQDRSRLSFAMIVVAVTILAIVGWIRQPAAKAQTPPAAPVPPMSATYPGGRPMRMVGGGTASVAAAGDYVYVVRGSTLYQFKASGLELVTQKDLPAPPVPQMPSLPTGSAPIAPGNN